MKTKDELVIRILENGEIMVEDMENGVKGVKKVSPETFLDCVRNSIRTNVVNSGILPEGTFSFTVNGHGERRVCAEFLSDRCDIVYEKTEYKDFPLPRLVFGFNLNRERITNVDIGVADTGMLTPKTDLFVYPFSNVFGFRMCLGMNRLPNIKSFHQLKGCMYFIMSMPNNNDNYQRGRTKLDLELRNLFETLRDKPLEYYYTDVLIPSGKTLADFIQG